MPTTDADLELLPPALRMAAAAGRPRTPRIRLPPAKNKSFQLRKEQVDALQKIRCQPREDMLTEDERRKQTLLRRRQAKERIEQEMHQNKLQQQSQTLMKMADSSVRPTATTTTSANATTIASGWERSDPEGGSITSRQTSNRRIATLKRQIQETGQRIDELQLMTPANASANEQNPKHSKDILQKKLEKVNKLLLTSDPSGKDYKKLSKKKEQYLEEMKELKAASAGNDVNDQLEEAKSELANLEQQLQHAIAEQKEEEEEERRRLAEAEEEKARRQKEEEEAAAAEARRIQRQNEEEEEERRRMAEAEEEEARRQKEEAKKKTVVAEEARRLKERAEELKAKQAAEAAPVSESDRRRQEAIEQYRRKQAEKKQAEMEAQQKAERLKEFKVLKKKLQKLEGMIDDAEEAGKDSAKLLKKKHEYISQLEEFDEWHDELVERRRKQEEEKLHKEREEAERKRKAELEAERRHQAELEAERRRKEAEEARIEAERLEAELRIREEQEQERLRQERLEEEQRKEELRIQQEKEDQQRRIEEVERAEREAEEEKQRALREAEFAKEQAELERTRAAQRIKDEEEQAQRREELREQTRAAEDEAATQQSAATTVKSEASQDFIDLRNIPEPHSSNTKKILAEIESIEQRQSKLEKTLKQNGVAVSEDIPYEAAKDKIAELQDQMRALAVSDEDQYAVQKKMYALEEDMSKYVTAMMLTDEFAEEQRMAEQKWEERIEIDNIAALRKVRSHMPVNIRNMSEEELTTNPTPNGKMLPTAFAKKFKRSNVLQLIRVNPTDLERMHPSLIEGLRSTGLTLTERRALHEHLKDVGHQWQDLQQDPSVERKYSWFLNLKSKFKEMVEAYDKHVKDYGPPSNHPYAKRNDPQAGGCPLLGNQCPVKADSVLSYDDDYGFTQEAEFEGGMPAPTKNVHQHKSRASMMGGGSKAKDEAIMEVLRERIHLTEPESATDSKLLRECFFAEKRTISLEKQLAQNGIALPKEDIPYAIAKAKVAEITEDIKIIASKMGNTMDMKEMDALEKEYSRLSDDLEKYNNALMLTKEWAQELLENERKWEEGVRAANQEALRKIRRHMPVNIKDLSEQDMIQGTTPNGKQLPQNIVRKFKRTNILQLVRMPPSMIEPMHPSSLEGMRSTGLTLTERRALHEHLKDLGIKWKAASNDKMSERKWMWHESLRGKFKELVNKYQQHIDQHGPPDNHSCPLLGKQCPIKADLEIDYSGDYGFPAEDVYNIEKVKKSNLLTVEELERRKQDDDWGYDAPIQQEEEPEWQSAAGTMATGIATSGSGSKQPKLAGGLMAAISAKGVDGNESTGNSGSRGGLLAAISAKGGGGGEDRQPPAKPEGEAEAPAPVSPTKKKRMGGLLAAITGRGKKE